jgi:hypothetical protein
MSISPATAFFIVVVVMQVVFTTSVILLVGRRLPARLRLYRWVAPAAVPILMFALIAFSFVSTYLHFIEIEKRPFDATMLVPLGPIAVGYGVLWLVGVLLAGMLMRLVLHRR